MFIVTKKSTISLVVLGAAVLIVIIIAVANMPLSDREIARRHLAKKGITVADYPCEVQDIEIPAEFDKTYQEYNNLQKVAGFDLTAYRGTHAVRYTFDIEKPEDLTPLRANVLVYERKVIGGDFCTTAVEGMLMPLTDAEQLKKELGLWEYN